MNKIEIRVLKIDYRDLLILLESRKELITYEILDEKEEDTVLLSLKTDDILQFFNLGFSFGEDCARRMEEWTQMNETAPGMRGL